MHQSTAPVPASESAQAHTAPPQHGTPEVPNATPEGSGQQVTNPQIGVGAFAQDMRLRNRVQRVDRDLHCGRPVSDDDLLQHREDCRFLMEVAHDRFLVSGEQQDLEEARSWMHRRDHAVQCLSAGWKAAREAQIQQAIGAGYFIEAGDRARAANEGSAG